MNRDEAYKSSIPAAAKEKVTEIWGDKSRKRAEYYLGKALVGIRGFLRNGDLSEEYSFRDGVRHGWTYYFHDHEGLYSAEPYENGKQHGTAYQWGSDGRLIGSYTMEQGTGLDLWRTECEDGSISLSEARYYVDEQRHGFEWGFYECGGLSNELHWQHGKLHGIERDFNTNGRLRRGYPRYWVNEERVNKAKYVRAAAKDPTLPPFRLEENQADREFPPEVAQNLRRASV